MLAPTSHEKQEINKETVFLKSTKLLTLLSQASLFSETSGMMKTTIGQWYNYFESNLFPHILKR